MKINCLILFLLMFIKHTRSFAILNRVVKNQKLISRNMNLFSNSNVETNLTKTLKMDKLKADDEYKTILNPTAYSVLRKKATEPRGITVSKGGFDDHFEDGTYVCGCCGTPLYESSHKFDCGCGWPGFWTNIKDAVCEEADADGFRCEILCSSCGGHLGHVFRNEGFTNPPPNERHCVNSVSIGFIPRGKGPESIQKCTYNGPVYGG
mmetsp:Transcript_3203/g.4974  ORF Transcript_3203/g.4974 Transcript_3203/m.4974 type:complete len:207 (-) Transcript_3203:41-661(-)